LEKKKTTEPDQNDSGGTNVCASERYHAGGVESGPGVKSKVQERKAYASATKGCRKNKALSIIVPGVWS